MHKKFLFLGIAFMFFVAALGNADTSTNATASAIPFPHVGNAFALSCPGNIANEGKACVDEFYCKCGASYGPASKTTKPDGSVSYTCPGTCDSTPVRGAADNLKLIACGMAGSAPACPSGCDSALYETTTSGNGCITCREGVICSEKKGMAADLIASPSVHA